MINMTYLSKLIKGDCLPEHDKKKRLLNQTCFFAWFNRPLYAYWIICSHSNVVRYELKKLISCYCPNEPGQEEGNQE